nr:MAG TPA: hypothetical protein [Caudoviricetes sp.]
MSTGLPLCGLMWSTSVANLIIPRFSHSTQSG